MTEITTEQLLDYLEKEERTLRHLKNLAKKMYLDEKFDI